MWTFECQGDLEQVLFLAIARNQNKDINVTNEHNWEYVVVCQHVSNVGLVKWWYKADSNVRLFYILAKKKPNNNNKKLYWL